MAVVDVPSTFEDVFSFEVNNDAERSVADALVLSVRNKGRLDLEYMSSITSKSKDKILEILVDKDAAYQNPEAWDESDYSNWELKSDYLSGNLIVKRQKIMKAITDYNARHIAEIGISSGDTVMHRTYGEGTIVSLHSSNDVIEVHFENFGFKYFLFPDAFTDRTLLINKVFLHRFDRNLKAIEPLIPKIIDISNITVRLGTPWITTDIIDEFIEHLLGWPCSYNPVPAKYRTIHDDTISGLWKIPEKSRFGARSITANNKYGTEHMNALHIIEHLLNNAAVTVNTTDPITQRSVLNKAETIEAREKARIIEQEFSDFINSSPHIQFRISQLYCEKFGAIVAPKYNGSIFDFPGLNPDVELLDHQRSAVARCILSPNTLLAHDVGAGKTYVMCVAAMEMKRMGISEHNLIVVPNSIVGQWTDYFHYLYEDAKILTVGPKDFTSSRKQSTLRKMRDGDYDAIIIAYSCFDRLNISNSTAQDEIAAEIKRIDKYIKNNKSRSVPGLNRMRERLQKKQDRLMNERRDSNSVHFDDLNINTLFIDEVHNYKNISINSQSSRLTYGVSNKGSAKNDSMLEKIHYVQKMNGGRGVIAASGTPITNSITDLYAIQTMLQSGELVLSGIHSFDEWIGAFARREDSLELDVDTSTFRTTTRYHFNNVPELALLLSSVADFHTVSEHNLPSNDGYEEIIVPQTDAMVAFNKSISERVEAIHDGRVRREKDNLLKVTIDSMKACLDLRLVDPCASFSTTSKVYYCAENVLRMYIKYASDKLAQLVFCDMSTPKDSFNIYSELKRILVLFGIPSEEIAFVHDATTDAAKSKLFAQTREGKIRVLIGSTKKLGTGTNVQNKLVAIHHLDVPWTPADMTQREGRILRTGNTCEKVHIFRYVVQNSFDAYSYQLLQQKQTFISEILQGCAVERDGKDIDMMLSYAEIKSICIGNENLKKRFEAANKLTRYRILRKKYEESHLSIRNELENLNKEIPEWTKRVSYLKKDAAISENQSFEGEKELHDKLNKMILSTVIPGEYGSKRTIYYRYHGFDIVRPAEVSEEDPCLFIRRNGTYTVSLKALQKNGNIDPVSRINNTIRFLARTYSNACNTLESLVSRRNLCLKELENDNIYDEQIKKYEAIVRHFDEILTETERNK